MTYTDKRVAILPVLVVVAVLAGQIGGCSPSDEAADSEPKSFDPITADAAELWDRQTTVTADLLTELAEDFNGTHTGLPVKPVSSGGYGDIYKKVIASIRAGVLPAMAVAYENMTAEYMKAGAITPLDSFIGDPETGLSQVELDDYFPAMLATNTFAQFDNQMLSFPYTKSVLVLYHNNRVMREAGLDTPPGTWDEFIAQCRTIKSKTGKYAIAIDIDCSTMSGIIFSMGGEILDGDRTLYDSAASIRAFELIEMLVTEELAYQIPRRTFSDENALGNDEIAFILRTSAQRPYLVDLFEDDSAWGIAPIPQADPDSPHTALYGGNLNIFNTNPELSASAWAFIKYMTSPEISVRWSLETGYLPVRRSAANHPDLKVFWSEWPSNRTAFDCLEFAKPEPNVLGWQEIRGMVEKAETAVITKLQTGRQAALELQKDAQAVLDARRK
ncbi:MAG: ABC transporter substrate-binding protein [Candidatus Hydrogenedentota bacterium]